MTITNPFTPSEIASQPDDFFGRTEELGILERSLPQGSVAIRGSIGIGKSSLLARSRLTMEGFDSEHRSKSVISVGDKDIKTVDDAARLVLESFIRIDEKSQKIRFKLGSILEIESAEICRYFSEGRHLAALKRVVEDEYLDILLNEKELLLLAIDEADKCPAALARLVRSVSTHIQQQNVVRKVRFVLAGVSPFFQRMIDEDPGVNRFFYRTVTLQAMYADEATELAEAKFTNYVTQAMLSGINISIDPSVISRIVALSGGHPHILQLLGSHVIESENEDPDGVIDARDLLSSLRKICYEDRSWVYDSAIHKLELSVKLESLKTLLDIMPNSFPTRIDIDTAKTYVLEEDLAWLVEHNFFSVPEPGYYGLVDEFLRIRLLLDELETTAETRAMEEELIRWVDVEEGGVKRDLFIADNESFHEGDGFE